MGMGAIMLSKAFRRLFFILISLTLIMSCTSKDYKLGAPSNDDEVPGNNQNSNNNTNTNNNNSIEPAVCFPVVSFGRNANDAVGVNSGIINSIYTPINVQDLTDVSAISAGRYHGLALKSDGTVWAWGDSTNGQLGNGTLAVSSEPKRIEGLSGVIAISAGAEHNLALKNDGTVWAWGANGFSTDRYGQVGNDSTLDQLTPVQVFSGAIAISAGRYHSMALKSDGTVWVWGRNDSGQLGDNTLVHKFTPIQVLGVGGVGFLSDVVTIYAGGYHNVVVKNDGTLWTWGYNTYGQLADNTTVTKKTPIQVMGLAGVGTLSDVVSVYMGRYHSLFVKSDGTVLSAGQGTYGQLGVNTVVNKKVLVNVLRPDGLGNLSGIVSVSGGQYFSFAVDATGNVYAWGSNNDGLLGDGTDTQRNLPVQLSGLGPVLFVEGGDAYAISLMGDHKIKSWGNGTFGELGHGPITIPKPSFVLGLERDELIRDISGGTNYSVVLKSDGSVWSLGQNICGQLGDNTVNDNASLIEAVGPVGEGHLTGITAIATGLSFTVGLKADGTVWTWGLNTNGQLGDGTLDDKHYPVQAIGVTDVVAVAAGGSHSLALKNDGTIWAWGANVKGQLGDNTLVTSSTPLQVKDPTGTGNITGIIAIAAGNTSSVALKSDGTVWTWGANTYGQLGDNTLVDKKLPLQVLGEGGVGYLEGVNAISTSGGFVIAKKVDGTVWAWGLNTNGQLGDGTATNKSTPVKVLGPGEVEFLTGVAAISAGTNHNLFLKADGTVWGVGSNIYGQLGEGRLGENLTRPIQISGVNNVTKIFAGRNRSMVIVNCNP